MRFSIPGFATTRHFAPHPASGSAGWALGHPPDGVDLDFDVADHVLVVSVRHAVKDGSNHYVDEIEVELNGKRIIEQKLGSQPDLKMLRVLYVVPEAGVGDKLKVTAGCNVFGKKSGEITIEAKAKVEARDESALDKDRVREDEPDVPDDDLGY